MIDSCIQFIHDYDTNIADKDNKHGLYYEFSEFAKHHKQRTTGKAERISRITFLNSNIGSIINDKQRMKLKHGITGLASCATIRYCSTKNMDTV